MLLLRRNLFHPTPERQNAVNRRGAGAGIKAEALPIAASVTDNAVTVTTKICVCLYGS